MSKISYLAISGVMCLGLLLPSGEAEPASATFVGEISDSMCGLKHTMGGNAKDCTLECVKSGVKLVLADKSAGKVYDLANPNVANAYAGQKVEITGTLQGKLIKVESIKQVK